MLISDEYLALNRELHERNVGYGTSGSKWAATVYGIAQPRMTTVLDYGAGQGTLKKAVEEQFSNWPYGLPPIPLSFSIAEYDPAIPGKDAPPEPADLVVCGDVLEHIEPYCLNAVLEDIACLAQKLVFLVIATRPAKKTLADGRNAHLIVEPIDWWVPQLIARWTPKQLNDFGGEFAFIGKRRS